MIDLRDEQARGPSAAIIACIAFLALMLLYLLFFPKPAYNVSAGQRNRRELDVKLATRQAEDRREEAKRVLTQRTYSGDAESVARLALGPVNRYAGEAGVRLLSFRPQRVAPGKDLNTVPFLVTVEGPFPNVMEFARALDRREPKLVLNLLQITSADTASSRVTVNLGLTAYTRVEPTTSPTPNGTNPS